MWSGARGAGDDSVREGCVAEGGDCAVAGWWGAQRALAGCMATVGHLCIRAVAVADVLSNVLRIILIGGCLA
jgi:hypothetical protein